MRFIFLFAILYWNCQSIAQLNNKYSFRHIDQTDGLLHTTVRGIGQDASGFIWILTLNGLQRYDGSRFVNYPEITNNASFGIFHDGELYIDTLKNEIWVMNGNEIQRLNLADNSKITIPLKEVLEKDSIRKAITYEDENMNYWQLNEKGVIRYDKDSSTIIGSYFNINPGQDHRNSYIIRDTSSDIYWLHNFRELLIADPKTKKIQSSSDQHPDHPLLKQIRDQFGKTNKIRFMMMDSYHNLWISTWTQYLLRYNMEDNILKIYSLKDVRKKQERDGKADLTLLVQAMLEDRQKNLWFATDYMGLLLYNREKDDFDYSTADEKITDGLRYSFSIYTIFQDRDDNIWLGTDRGISIFNPYKNYFQTIRHIEGTRASLPKYDINDVIETPQNEILVATWGGGISIYDHALNFVRNVEFTGPNEYNLVWSFVQNDDGMIWAGTQQGYIHKYDPVKHTWETIQPPEIAHSTITMMTKDHKGNILMGLNNGKVAVWNKEEKSFYAFGNDVSSLPLNYTAVVNIFVDKSNRCWVATATGLFEFDIQQRIYTHEYRPDSTGTSIGFSIEGIEEYNDSILAIATNYGGLYLFNLNTYTFSRFSISNPFNLASVYAVKKDRHNNLWFTTNYSLHKINEHSGQAVIYNVNHSMMNAAFGSCRFYELNDGRWLTSTPAEIICFDPEQISHDHDEQFEVEISRFKVFDHPIYIDSFIERQKPVILPYDKNFISVEFSALDFSDLKQINYFYRLSGVDKNWIPSYTKNFADYTDLKPGKYLFEVKADNGTVQSAISTLPIIITPPWWGTLWFRILTVLTLVTFIYWIIRNRLSMIRKESELKQQIVQTEMMALRSQMNPHFIFNCINSIDAMIQSNDKYRATMYLNKFAKLIRNVLDSSKQNKVPLSKDIETLQLYVDLELFRHQAKFTASIEVEEELMQNDYKVPPLIIQPYVENAILHGLRQKNGGNGKLKIVVTKQDDQIVYIIEDNGVGRKGINGDMNKHSRGYGMQMSNDRIRLFNEEEIASVMITDLDMAGLPGGTRIQVKLKIH